MEDVVCDYTVELTAVYTEGLYSVVKWGTETRNDSKVAALAITIATITIGVRDLLRSANELTLKPRAEGASSFHSFG